MWPFHLASKAEIHLLRAPNLLASLGSLLAVSVVCRMQVSESCPSHVRAMSESAKGDCSEDSALRGSHCVVALRWISACHLDQLDLWIHELKWFIWKCLTINDKQNIMQIALKLRLPLSCNVSRGTKRYIYILWLYDAQACSVHRIPKGITGHHRAWQGMTGHDRAGEGMTNERLLPAKLIGCQALQGHRLHPFLVIPADCAGCLQESNECKQGMKTLWSSSFNRFTWHSAVSLGLS